jgi:hypothetical protein
MVMRRVVFNPRAFLRTVGAAGDAARPPVDLLRAFGGDLMVAFEVSKDVGSVKNNRPDLIEAIAV